MLRIAVTGVPADDLRQVGLRLRGAAVEPWEGSDPSDPILESAEAVAFFGDSAGRLDSIARTLAARKSVLLMARGGLPIESLEKLAAIAGEHCVRLVVGNPDHALPSRRLIRQQIENGKLGEVGLVRIMRGERIPASARPVASLPEALIGDLELTMWLVGRMPDTTYAIRRQTATPQSPNGACMQVHLGFPHGGSALVTWTSAWCSQEPHHSLSVIASTGAAYADDLQNRQLLYGDGAPTAPLADEGPATTAILQEFVDGLKTASPSGDGLDGWRRVTQVVAAVQQSLDTQQAVSLKVD